jgi:trigger factor
MLKTVEDISETKKRLRIEIPPDAIEREIKNALNRLRAKTKIPGFRPGKAPIALLEKRFGKEVETEAMERIIPEYYANALREANITPVSNPVFEEGLDFKRNSPLNMTLLVEVRPKIEGLNYKGIKVKDIPVSVEDSDVEGTLKRLQEEKATYEPSEEPVKTGDLVIIDYEIKEEGKKFTDQVFKVGSERMLKEFSEKLMGMKKGEDKEFEITFPEDFHVKEFAGKTLGFKVSLKDVKKVNLPPIDDELAKDVGFESLDALKEHIRKEILKSKEDAVSKILKAEVVKKILDAHEFEAPESLVNEELQRLVDEARAGGRTETEDALRQEFLPAAKRHVRASILLQTIGEKEGIKVTEDDVKEKVKVLSEKLSLTPENVMKYYITRDGSLDGLRHSIFEEKVLDFLLEHAEVEKGD